MTNDSNTAAVFGLAALLPLEKQCFLLLLAALHEGLRLVGARRGAAARLGSAAATETMTI